MDFDNVVKKRASIRRYSLKKPPTEKIIEAIAVANTAPSPGNLEIIKFVIVENPDTIEKISKGCRQDFIKEAPYVVVICSKSKRVEMLYDKRADLYVKQHAGAVIENFLLKITELGLAACWVGAFSDLTIKPLLRIPDNIEIQAIIPIGYLSKADKTEQKPKHSLNNRVYFEVYRNKHQKPFGKIGET
jgi:nitroreductase